jgi:hypothetical protein
MMKQLGALLLAAAVSAAAPSASAQDKMLAPPDTRYFVGKGSWGQNYPDQWALQRIGFDASPQSAWRLVKRDAQPVIVAIIDTGLDWNHQNIDADKLWRNDKEIPDNGVDDDRNGYVDDVIGWDFLDRDAKPWDNDGHGTLIAGILAGDWNDKAGIAGVNPFARLMILKGLNNFGHTRASYVAEAIAYATDNGARVINLSVGAHRHRHGAAAAAGPPTPHRSAASASGDGRADAASDRACAAAPPERAARRSGARRQGPRWTDRRGRLNRTRPNRNRRSLPRPARRGGDPPERLRCGPGPVRGPRGSTGSGPRVRLGAGGGRGFRRTGPGGRGYSSFLVDGVLRRCQRGV